MSDVASPEELAPARSTPASYRFQLFVTGDSLLSLRARQHVARFLVEPLGERAEVEVVDLIANPAIARRERIVATPTLVRLEPSPVVRLIGDLTDFEHVRSLVLVGDDHLIGDDRLIGDDCRPFPPERTPDDRQEGVSPHDDVSQVNSNEADRPPA